MAEWPSGWSSRSKRVGEWLSGWSSRSGRVAEWLSGWSSHSGRVAEWLSGCFDFASRVAHPLPFCIYVHFAPPCGTSSRARLIQRRGRWNPPIVRTDQTAFLASLESLKPVSKRQMNYIKSPVTLLNFACLIKSTFQWKILEDHSCG